jgi:cell division protein FtsZ
LLEASIDGAYGVLLLVQGASDLGLHEIDEAARLVQEAVSPEANIIFGATIDDTLGDEVRITVIAAGFEGGQPKAHKFERKAFSGLAGLGAPASAAAPAAATAPAATSWFNNGVESNSNEQAAAEPVSTDTSIFNAVVADFDANTAEENGLASIAAKADAVDEGTWGDGLDIPEFLRDK